jgi:high affinity sulphate transporter 1
MEKVYRILPGLKTFLHYRREYFRHDLFAGIGVAAVAVPVAMAYAQIIGFEPVVGLYAAILPLVVYALFGTSRYLIVNPDAATCAMVAASLTPLAAQNPESLVSLSVLLSLLTGIFCLVAGFFRLGFIADFLSRPVLVGFLNGIAIHIFLGQIGKVFGFPMKAHGIVPSLIEFIHKIPMTHLPTLVVGSLTILVILAGKRFLPRWPAPLLAVVFAVALVYGLGLDSKGVAVVGQVPQGLPPLRWPAFESSWVVPLIGDSLAVALLSFSNAMVVARVFAAKSGDTVNTDKELFALGACQIATSISQGFAVSAADSRTAINYGMGARSQVSGLVAAGVMVMILLFFTQPLAYLPNAALGAVLIVAAIGLFDAREMLFLWRLSRSEFAVAVVTMLGVVGFGVLGGILLATGLSLLFLLIRISRPPDALLGRVPGMKGFHNIEDYPNAEVVPGLMLFRFRAALLFVNASYFSRRLYELLVEHPDTQWLIVDGGTINNIDSTAAEMLGGLAEEMRLRGIHFGVANLRQEVQKLLERASVLGLLGPNALFPTLKSAMEAFLASRALRSPSLDRSEP